LVWLWIKEGKPLWYGALGAIILLLYALIATLQTANFARSYAAYGGIFIVLSLLWAYKFDNFRPYKYDFIGAAIALLGICVICYAPRR
jgi:small multidrug resistance family-3 protein